MFNNQIYFLEVECTDSSTCDNGLCDSEKCIACTNFQSVADCEGYNFNARDGTDECKTVCLGMFL